MLTKKEQTVEGFLDGLTKKQYDITVCLLFCNTYKLVARTLNLSDRTIESHVRMICNKAKIANKSDLIRWIKLSNNGELEQKLKDRFQELTLKNDTGVVFPHNVRNLRRMIIWGCVFCVVFLSLLGAICYRSTDREIACYPNIPLHLLERNNLLEQIRYSSGRNPDIKIIFGVGGAGKTTLARESIVKGRYKVSCEINAESFSSLKKGIITFAYLIADSDSRKKELTFLSGIGDEKERLKRTIAFIYSCLKNIRDWCLLFDNVDDLQSFKQICLDTIPKDLKGGRILITTRNFEANLRGATSVFVGELSEEEKASLFSKITGENKKQHRLSEIPSYPLDVSCCAYYIKNTNILLTDYIDKMKMENKKFWENNKDIISENSSYVFTRNEIISSLFDQIIQDDPRSIKILFTLALMDSQNIPLTFVRKIDNTATLDKLVIYLRKYGLISFDGNKNEMSFHRSTHSYMLKYSFEKLDPKDQKLIIQKFINTIVYRKLSTISDSVGLIPHLKCLERNIEKIQGIDKEKLELDLTLGILVKENNVSSIDSIQYFNKCLDIDGKYHILSEEKRFSVLLAAGKACLDSNQNQQALEYLKKSFVSSPYKGKFAVNYAKNYVYIGIGYIRGNHLLEALNCFKNAIGILEKEPQTFDVRLAKALAYLKQGRCYIMYYINKPQINISLEKIRQAIAILDKDTDKKDAIKIIARAKLIMAGVYNALKEYKKALLLADEAESWLGKLPKDNSYFCSMSMVLAEKGHATLRLNELKKAKSIFAEAHELMDKTMIGDYLFRTRMQEAETLIRLKDYKSAYQNCLDVFERKDKEKNDLCDLFFNTALYNAAVIKYKTGDYTKALNYFSEFALHMKDFCRSFLSDVQYEQLNRAGVFEQVVDEKDMKICFKNAWLIFSTVCLKGSEFITDYVEQNYKDAR